MHGPSRRSAVMSTGSAHSRRSVAHCGCHSATHTSAPKGRLPVHARRRRCAEEKGGSATVTAAQATRLGIGHEHLCGYRRLACAVDQPDERAPAVANSRPEGCRRCCGALAAQDDLPGQTGIAPGCMHACALTRTRHLKGNDRATALWLKSASARARNPSWRRSFVRTRRLSTLTYQ